MERLLLPELLLARLHIRNVAGQPVMEFHLQFCFERFGIHSRTHSSDQVQEVGMRPLQPRRRSIDQQSPSVSGSQKSGMPHPASFAP